MTGDEIEEKAKELQEKSEKFLKDKKKRRNLIIGVVVVIALSVGAWYVSTNGVPEIPIPYRGE